MKTIVRLLMLGLLLHNCTGELSHLNMEGDSPSDEKHSTSENDHAMQQREDEEEKEKYSRTLTRFTHLLDDPDADFEDVEYFLKKHAAQVKKQAIYGSRDYTFLHSAIARGEMDTTEELLELSDPALINAKDPKTGRTLLHIAAMDGNLRLVKVLANAKGIDINIRDNNGGHVLHYAVAGSHLNIVKFLLEECENRARIENIGTIVDVDGISLLHGAAMRRRAIEMVGYFLAQSKRPEFLDRGDEFGNTALHFAAGLGKKTVVQLLLEAGAKKGPMMHSGENMTPYDLALREGHKEIADFIQQFKK